jgi:hypothetical protein
VRTAIVGTVALLGFVVTIGVLVMQGGDGRAVAAVHAPVAARPVAEGGAGDVAGTFVLAFSLLRGVRHDFVPDIGVTVAGVAVAASLGLLLIYLDRFTHNLRPAAVTALVIRSAGRSDHLDRADVRLRSPRRVRVLRDRDHRQVVVPHVVPAHHARAVRQTGGVPVVPRRRRDH